MLTSAQMVIARGSENETMRKKKGTRTNKLWVTFAKFRNVAPSKIANSGSLALVSAGQVANPPCATKKSANKMALFVANQNRAGVR